MLSTPSETLLNTYLAWDTQTFSTLATSVVLQSKDPAKALKEDPPVLARVLDKKKDGPEHEFIVNELSHNIKYALERTVSPNPPPPDHRTVDRFLNHPTSQKFLDAILETVDKIPSPVLVGGAAVAVGAALAAPGPVSIPVAGSTAIPLSLKSGSSSLKSSSSHLPVVNEGPRISSSHLPLFSPVSVAPEYSLTERTTMSIGEVLQAMSDSRAGRIVAESLNKDKLPADAQANDRFLGMKRFDNDEYNSAIRLMVFRPKRLTRVHIALLAKVIHEQHPLYSLLRRQCYWFASTFIFTAKVIDQQLEGRKREEAERDDGHEEDMYMPFQLFAHLAGCWKGIRIHGVQLVLVNRIIEQFDAEYGKFLDEVLLYSFNYYRLLNS